ncbi:hypothetical protein AVEN_100496-1 [Araneus ventricosus]|nr:hypothetical protein AVEN_100496-1 [Araneus ventricosus]
MLIPTGSTTSTQTRSRRGLGGLVVRSRYRRGRVPALKPDTTEDTPCMWDCYTLNHSSGTERPPVGVVRKFGEGLPAQVSSSSFESVSKLRGPSINSPRVAWKRDVNITKLN